LVERVQIAITIEEFQLILGTINVFSGRFVRHFFDDKLTGKLDCNNDKIITSTYMPTLNLKDLTQLYLVEDTRVRNFDFNGWPNTTA
jgi:hypothetical protein